MAQDETGKYIFDTGNQLWKLRKVHGPKMRFKNPEELLEQSLEYFKTCDENPLKVEKLFHYQGEITSGTECRMRAYTWSGLQVFLGMYSLRDYKTNTDGKYDKYQEVVAQISKIIYTQKLEGAAAGLLEHNIIRAELGLKDKKEHSGNVDVGGTWKTEVTHVNKKE